MSLAPENVRSHGTRERAKQNACPTCGREGNWVPPTRIQGNFAISTFRCQHGHTWEMRVQ
jgi:hypothetical protein